MDGDDRLRRNVLLAVALGAIALFVGLFFELWVNRMDCVATDFVLNNWKVVLGLPFMCLGSFIVVALFKQPSTPIEFSALGLKFKGSAGEVVLWCLCFLSMAGAVKLLAGSDSRFATCSAASAEDGTIPMFPDNATEGAGNSG